MSMGRERYLDYRTESRDEWGVTVEVGDTNPVLDDDQMRTGALLRIADALERAYPVPVDEDAQHGREHQSRVRAYEVFLRARGLNPDETYYDWNLSDALETALEYGSPNEAERAAELCSYADYYVVYCCRLTESQAEELRTAMKVRGFYFDNEWPD